MKKKRLGLKAKIILPIIVLNIIVFLAQVFVFQETIRQTIRTEFKSKGRAVIQALSSSIQDTLLNRDASTLQGFIDQYRNIKGVEYIFIVNGEGEIVAHTFSPKFPDQLKTFVENSSGLEATIESKEITYEKFRVLNIRAPILAGLLGNVFIGMALEKEEADVIIPLILRSLIFRGLLAAIGILISAYILHRAITPIVNLTRAANGIVESKDLNVNVEMDNNDEVGDLSRSFNYMIGELRNYTEDLETRVKQRTFDLAKTNRELKNSLDELQKAKSQLVHSSKMSSLGEMAGGIAHEINNPLTIIAGKSEILRNMIESGRMDHEKMVAHLNRIGKTTDRIAAIIKGLRRFSRDASKDPFESVPLKELVDDTLELSQERIKKNGVELKVDEIPENLTISCQPVQLSQVFLNLLNNAFDAVVSLKEKWIHIELKDHGNQIQLNFVDSGAGIPKDISERILEPFFTTKEVGKGTGLGLSISSTILQEHRGQLSIDHDRPNTCFVITLQKGHVGEKEEKRAA